MPDEPRIGLSRRCVLRVQGLLRVQQICLSRAREGAATRCPGRPRAHGPAPHRPHREPGAAARLTPPRTGPAPHRALGPAPHRAPGPHRTAHRARTAPRTRARTAPRTGPAPHRALGPAPRLRRGARARRAPRETGLSHAAYPLAIRVDARTSPDRYLAATHPPSSGPAATACGERPDEGPRSSPNRSVPVRADGPTSAPRDAGRRVPAR